MTSFWADIKGQIAITAALVIPILAGSVGMAVDYTAWTAQSRKLQGVADAAAIASARELYLANATDAQIEAVADLVANAQLENQGGTTGSLSVSTDIQHDRGAVEVTVTQPRTAYFSELFDFDYADLSAIAVARAAGGGRVCVIGLDGEASGTLLLSHTASLNAPECAVYSNSLDSAGIDVAGNAHIEAELVCSAGGVDASDASFVDTVPLTDCPQIQDPLAERPAPSVGECDYEDLEIMSNRLRRRGSPLTPEEEAVVFDWTSDGRIVLEPGTYCGGILASNSNLFFEPGIYVIADGPFEIEARTSIIGEHVGIYLYGDGAEFSIESQSVVRLTAPVDGPMAGLLMFEDRNAQLGRHHIIKSNNASVLLGTLYFPRGIFIVDTNARVAEDSAYTAIVARQLQLRRDPQLFLNADYDATDIPVPDGVGPVGGNIFLER